MVKALVMSDTDNPHTGSLFDDFMANELYPNSTYMQEQWKVKTWYLYKNNKHTYSVLATRLKPEDIKE